MKEEKKKRKHIKYYKRHRIKGRKEKQILLIDADSIIPNIPLMKLSTYHKNKGDHIKLIKWNIPYYPGRKRETFFIPKYFYDKIYISIIFNTTKKSIKGKGKNVIFGGSGYSLENNLPRQIEELSLDYSLYPENDTSFGFISRGCIRNCYFCIVPKKEGKIRQVDYIDNIVRHNKVKFLDNNFLALPNHKILLKELINKEIRCQFNQGLDIRLLDKENSDLLYNLNYIGNYTFAFDDIALKNLIKKKLELLKWRKEYQLRFFVYCNSITHTIKDVIRRVMFLKKRGCLVYLMRDLNCWGSSNQEFYNDLASWCNQPGIFKKMDFPNFVERRHVDEERVMKNIRIWKKNQAKSLTRKG